MVAELAGTARWIAAARARESRRPDRLFDDPWAEQLAGPGGFAALERHDPSGNPFLPLRTWWFDTWCTRTTQDGSRQVVLVAAGLDTRAYRLSWPPGTVLYELDRADLLADKDRILRLAGADAGCDRRPVGVDLLDDWTTALLAAGFDSGARTSWLVEGLLVYLTEQTAHRLLSTAGELTSAEGCLAADVVGTSFLTSPWMRPFLRGLADAGVPWRYGTDQPEALLTAAGWTPEQVLQPGDIAPPDRPWPYPSLPRDVPSVPHSYLFTATRRRL